MVGIALPSANPSATNGVIKGTPVNGNASTAPGKEAAPAADTKEVADVKTSSADAAVQQGLPLPVLQ